ncbi:MAG TPA: DivIVA domain-containing protein [Gemmatimonadales bacterium]|nr:DivIVA domain-containing protein [Gemmatimonadales bacterium]
MNDDVFRLTPLDLRKQEFRKTMRGYDPAEVDDFRVRAADELERVIRERMALEEVLARAEEQLAAFREREKAMNAALVSAQQLRAETREQAEREAQMIVREAEAEGERHLDRARREIERLEAMAQNLARQHHAYLAALRSLVERQKAELDAMADAQPAPFGKVAGAIQPAAEVPEPRETRKSSPKWIKNIVEE